MVHRLHLAFLVLDAIGLVVFTIAGCDVALQLHESLPIVIVAGMITGCAGGVLRDILCNDVPLLFRSELYASVSAVTGAIYVAALWLGLHHDIATALAFAVGLDLPAAGDPVQMGDAEIRLHRRAALKPRSGRDRQFSQRLELCAAKGVSAFHGRVRGRSSGLFVLPGIGGYAGLKPPGFGTHHIEKNSRDVLSDE